MTRIHEALREIAPEGDEAFIIHAVPAFVPSEVMPILKLVESEKPIPEFVDDLRFAQSTPYPAISFVNPNSLPRPPIKPRSAMEPPAGRPSRQIAGRTKPRSKYSI